MRVAISWIRFYELMTYTAPNEAWSHESHSPATRLKLHPTTFLIKPYNSVPMNLSGIQSPRPTNLGRKDELITHVCSWYFAELLVQWLVKQTITSWVLTFSQRFMYMHSCRIIQTCDNTLTCEFVTPTPNSGMLQSTEQSRIHKKVHKNTKGADSQSKQSSIPSCFNPEHF